MTTRKHIQRPIRDGSGNLVPNVSVRILEPGTTNLISQILYQASAGTSSISNPFVCVNGIIDFYLDRAQTVRVGVVLPGASAETFFEDVQIGGQVEVYTYPTKAAALAALVAGEFADGALVAVEGP